jgi:hypothetical protein
MPPFYTPEGLEYFDGSFYIGNVFGGKIMRIAMDGSMEVVLPRGSAPEHFPAHLAPMSMPVVACCI